MKTNDIKSVDELLDLRERTITAEQRTKFEGYVAEIFSAMGMEMGTQSTEQTPKRFINALLEATEGYDGDSKLIKTFGSECQSGNGCSIAQIIQGPIPFHSLCEHHVLPFFGNVYVGYIASEKIIGLSKLTRLVNLASRRFAVQERIGQQVAYILEATTAPEGIAVYIEAHHLCMEMRGVREREPLTRTTVWRGSYATDPTLRSEFLQTCGVEHHGRI